MEQIREKMALQKYLGSWLKLQEEKRNKERKTVWKNRENTPALIQNSADMQNFCLHLRYTKQLQIIRYKKSFSDWKC